MKKILFSVFLVLSAMPAFSAITIYNTPEGDKVDIYGSIRLSAGYQNTQGFDEGKWISKKSDLSYMMITSSRFGLNFKIGDFFGTMETNFNMDGGNLASFGFRQLFAGYDFGRGHKLTIGQQSSVTGAHRYFDDFWMNNNGFSGFGVLYVPRRPMVKYSYYGLDVAFIVNTDAVDRFVGNGSTDEDGVIADYKQGPVYIPRFEIAYNFKSGDNFKGTVGGSYALFTEKHAINGSYANVNAFHVMAILRPTFGAGFMNATAFYSMNGAMYGAVRSLQLSSGLSSSTDVRPSITGGKVNDVHSWGVAVNGGYSFNEIVGFTIGAGYQMNISDKYKTAEDKKHSLNSYGIYAQVPVKINKYMKIVPSVGYYSSFYSGTSKDARNDVSTLLAGALFIANF